MDYGYSYDYDLSPYARDFDSSAISSTASGVIGATLAIYFVIILVVGILQIIAMWKVFTKAGEKGWKSIIPIYNLIILFKVSGLSPLLILVYLAGIIPFVGWIACLVITIVQANSLSKSFGKGAGFTVGLVLLPTIFYMILGFGKAKYIGKTNEETL